jgi:hypothetical protein
MRLWLVTAVVLMMDPSQCMADRESQNKPFVVVSEHGECYGKSTPDEPYGEKGTTRIFRVENGPDSLLQTYSWFAREFYIDCGLGAGSGVSVVQLGPWARGQAADQGTLAIAFYLNGHLLKRYSTLDIAGSPDNVRRSVAHYQVFEKVLGYRWGTGRQRFVVRTVDNRTLVFDPELGTQVTDKIAEKEQQ